MAVHTKLPECMLSELLSMAAALTVSLLLVTAVAGEYQIGVGIADVTGPIAEIGFMGYGKLDQKGTGLHLRQWARSYIVDDGDRRVVFVNVDVGMIGDSLRLGVLSNLEKMFGTVYTKENVIISGTHTHSAPGGFLTHLLFDLPILGFSHETYGALASGIVQSIMNAHNNMQPGKVYFGAGSLRDASINRSPTAYLNNPEEERSRYDANVDWEMVQLKFVSESGKPLGVINWFPVHPTSMNNTNTLVSSDNVGYASIKFEERMNPNRILGNDIWNSENAAEVTGPVRSLHQYKDMSNAQEFVVDENGQKRKIRGCYPAMGYSFAAGTTDGPGAFSFQQATLTENPLWNIVRDFLSPPTEEDIRCHAPKPILLATGRMKFPYDWQPSIVSTQVALIGNVLLACLPGEFTTMAGRRMRSSLLALLEDSGINEPKVILAGLCNTYSDYITTFEEYQVQRYEGASTIYGPHTLTLHLIQYRKLTEALVKGVPLDGGPRPQGLERNMISLITPVVFDTPRIGYKFGDVVLQPPGHVNAGDVVRVRFISGHPRNNLRHGDSYCTIEKRENADVWTVVATDANWETKVRWIRVSKILGTSEIEVEWAVPTEVITGTYRIRHFGDYRFIFGGIFPYSGTTRSFQVLGNSP